MKEEIGQLLKRTSEIQAQMKKVQKKLNKQKVVGVSGGGLVKVEMTGRNDASNVSIDDSLLLGDKEVLEELIAGAINDAVRRVEELSEETISDFASELSFDPSEWPF